MIFIFLFFVIFSFESFAKWTKIGRSVSGSTFYVDFETIRKHGEYVYWWELQNYIKPNKFGDFSSKGYHQGDCALLRVKYLSMQFFKQQMGQGTFDVLNPKPVELSSQVQWVVILKKFVIDELNNYNLSQNILYCIFNINLLIKLMFIQSHLIGLIDVFI